MTGRSAAEPVAGRAVQGRREELHGLDVAVEFRERGAVACDRTEQVALRRLGTVEDCAKVVEFLVTDLSDYVTGTVIPIDGGLLRS